MQSVHAIVIDPEIMCDSILCCKHIVNLISKIGCVDGRDTLIDVSTDVPQ